MEILINPIIITSGVLGIFGFLRLLKFTRDYTNADVDKYVRKHKTDFKKFCKVQTEMEKKRDEELGHVSGPISDSEDDFYKKYRNFQRTIAITLVISGLILSIILGVIPCLLCLPIQVN